MKQKIQRLMRQGKKIEAIKVLRKKLPQLTIRELKHAVHTMAEQGEWPEHVHAMLTPPAPPAPPAPPTPLATSGLEVDYSFTPPQNPSFSLSGLTEKAAKNIHRILNNPASWRNA